MITAIVSKKGGVGKTTTSVGIAAALAGIGKKVLLVDLDSQASASLSLGVDRAKLGPSVADSLLHRTPIDAVVRSTQVDRLDLITASADLVSLDAEFGLSRDRHAALAKVLEPIKSDYHFIIIDCPPSLTLASIMALHAADNFISPVVPEYLATVGVKNLLRSVERIGELGKPTRCLGLVLNRVDYRTLTHRENVAELRDTFGSQVFAVEIRTNISLAQAPALGKTILQHSQASTGARAMRLLAAEALIRLNHPHTKPIHELPRPGAQSESTRLHQRTASPSIAQPNPMSPKAVPATLVRSAVETPSPKPETSPDPLDFPVPGLSEFA